jgi:hypothetical protein
VDGSGQCIILLERAAMVLQGTEGKLGTIDVVMYGRFFTTMQDLGMKLEQVRQHACDRNMTIEREYIDIPRFGHSRITSEAGQAQT